MHDARDQDVRALRGDPALRQQLVALSQTDNVTNFFYVARAWAVILVAGGGAIAFHRWQTASAWSFWWNVPVFFMAAVLIGASQHQLAGATHEATHQLLFKSRVLNELISEWLCMYPLFSSTHVFRLHHLAHHGFVNDPERDPDFSQLRESGHWLDFPVRKAQFLRFLLRQFLLVPPARYILVRVRYNSLGVDNNVFQGQRSPKAQRRAQLLLAFAGLLVAVLAFLPRRHPGWTLVVPWSMWAGLVAVLAVLPADWYEGSRIPRALPARVTDLCRTAFLTGLFSGLFFLQRATGFPALRYFVLLWIVPLLTSFSFFMILRQLVQHGNGDRGWLTNTRVFLVNPWIRYAVFPFGMDYHLPHHMFALVPHYRLPQLHDTLQRFDAYRRQGTVVKNYFFTERSREARRPSVLDVLSCPHAGGAAATRIGAGSVAWRHAIRSGIPAEPGRTDR